MNLSNDTTRAILAYLMVTIAAGMVFAWIFRPPSGDANTVALLAGFVMLFVKGAMDYVSYYIQSSAGSDKKTDAILSGNGKSPTN